MKKVAICIGVNNIEGFAKLKGAVLGAKKFSEWAVNHGYEVKLFLDEDNNVVSGNDIFRFIKECIDSQKYTQLIVYFSGHGISRGPNQEFWLLSEATSNPNEFVNVTSSFDNARDCSIPYVLFISDACRSLPNSFNQTMGGHTLFPVINSYESSVVDIFYATRPGAPALEVKGNNLVKSYGIFTECLLDYLKGKYTDTIANYEKDSKIYLSNYYEREKLLTNFDYKSLPNVDQKWIISAVEVDLKLTQIVEERAFTIKKDQSPRISVSNHKKEFPLATYSDEQGKKLIIGVEVEENGLVVEHLSPLTEEIGNKAINLATIKNISHTMWEFRDNKEAIKINIKKEEKKKLFVPATLFSEVTTQIRTGFTLNGEKVEDFIVNGGSVKILKNNIVEIGNDSDVSSGLLVLKSGRSIPLPIIKGFVGNLIFRKGYLFTINYTPSTDNQYAYNDYLRNEKMLRKKRNYVAIAANNGFNYQSAFEQLKFDLGGNLYDDAGSFLRIGKSLDPSLGLYAAYAFRENGDVNKIKSVFNYMRRDNRYVIFDVAMLAGELRNDTETALFCPLMSVGWSYTHLYEGKVKEVVLEAAKNLMPGLWTMFNKEGTEIIKNAILNHEII